MAQLECKSSFRLDLGPSITIRSLDSRQWWIYLLRRTFADRRRFPRIRSGKHIPIYRLHVIWYVDHRSMTKVSVRKDVYPTLTDV